jgi:hypothetical protein
MDTLINWLMEGDPAIRWQTQRDLLDQPEDVWQAERLKTTTDGWGARYLSHQDPAGTWGGGIYSPKWISTTYTLLQLHEIGLPGDHPAAQWGTRLIMDTLGAEGSEQFQKNVKHWDLCVSGMDLGLAVYFKVTDTRIDRLVEDILDNQMPDGGWNCSARKDRGVTHSSLHTTINVLEGLRTCIEAGTAPHLENILIAEQRALEFMLEHKLFKSHKTGEIINIHFTELSYPSRWHYDFLRGLDYFQRAGAAHDIRLQDAIELLVKKRRKDHTWPVQHRHPALSFFDMEKTGGPSRWNTLRALRVLRWWQKNAN